MRKNSWFKLLCFASSTHEFVVVAWVCRKLSDMVLSDVTVWFISMMFCQIIRGIRVCLWRDRGISDSRKNSNSVVKISIAGASVRRNLFLSNRQLHKHTMVNVGEPDFFNQWVRFGRSVQASKWHGTRNHFPDCHRSFGGWSSKKVEESCGLWLVVVLNERMECRVSSRAASDCEKERSMAPRFRETILQRVPFKRSTWPFPWGLIVGSRLAKSHCCLLGTRIAHSTWSSSCDRSVCTTAYRIF